MGLKIETLALDQLTPYEGNAKLHPQEQIEQIADSIEVFGMNDPIAVWGKDNVIIEGHGRYEACRLLGIKEVPCIRLDHLTEEQRVAYTLVHNKLTLNSDFDLELLEVELGKITDIDMEAFGFPVEEEEPELRDDNYLGALPAQPKSKRGQIYQLGEHRLMVGDSTEEEDVYALMGGEEADLCITDPPYNVAIENSQGMTIDNDDQTEASFEEFLTAAFSNMQRALRDGAGFYIWYASRTVQQFLNALEENGLTVRETLIWVKNSLVLGRSDYHWQHEPCLYGWKDGTHYFTEDRTQTTVIDETPDIEHMKKEDAIALLRKIFEESGVIHAPKPKIDDLHPTMKPVEIIGKFVLNSSMRGDVVLDLFGGSGTTLICCEQAGRKCRMMEYDPRYADVIIDRWEEFTGEEAVLLNGNE